MNRSIDFIQLALGRAPRRIVSLVPSYTESLFQLGFGDSVVGITDYCTHPPVQVDKVHRVGGPKNANVNVILSLQPDLVIANQEENSPEIVEKVESAGVPVWLSFPKTVQDALDVLWGMVDLFSDQTASLQVRFLEDSIDWLKQTAEMLPQKRYFCPIWQGTTNDEVSWWMTFNQDTYSNDLLSLYGGINIFNSRKRQYPLTADLGLSLAEPEGERDTRYPCVRVEEIVAHDPDIILLPNEPYQYDHESQEHLKWVFRDTSAVMNDQVYLIDGSLITWYGTRLAMAVEELPQYFIQTT